MCDKIVSRRSRKHHVRFEVGLILVALAMSTVAQEQPQHPELHPIIPYLENYTLLNTNIHWRDSQRIAVQPLNFTDSKRTKRIVPVHGQLKCTIWLRVETTCAAYNLCLRPSSIARSHLFNPSGKAYVFGTPQEYGSQPGRDSWSQEPVVFNLTDVSDSLVEGYAENHASSSVTGYVYRSKFYGRIFADGQSFVIEPLATFYQRVPEEQVTTPPESDFNAVIYREIDMQLPPDFYTSPVDSEDLHESYNLPSLVQPLKGMPVAEAIKSKEYTDAMFGPSNVFHRDRNDAKVCTLVVAADDRFFRYVGQEDALLTMKIMAFIIKEADFHFRAMDFNDDGIPDNIGFRIDEMRVYAAKNHPENLLLGEYDLAYNYLWQFSRYNFDGACLGLAFTHRLFQNQVQGKAWIATAPPNFRLGGICQKQTVLYGFSSDGASGGESESDKVSLNTVAISLHSAYLELIPTPMAITVLLHELGHAFGAPHDEPDNETCHPGKSDPRGNFIMAPTSNNGQTVNNWNYSPCSKSTMTRVLETKSTCFWVSQEPYCGNGRVEEGEECDCGTRENCLTEHSCCGHPFSPYECKFRRDLSDCHSESPVMEIPFPKENVRVAASSTRVIPGTYVLISCALHQFMSDIIRSF